MYRHCAVKDPDSTLDYGFDWGKHWLPEGVTISTSQWIVAAPLTVVSSAVSDDNKKTLVILSGGDVGATYRVTNRVTLSDGVRTDDRTIKVIIQEK